MSTRVEGARVGVQDDVEKKECMSDLVNALHSI
jgi:hypothetical protein